MLSPVVTESIAKLKFPPTGVADGGFQMYDYVLRSQAYLLGSVVIFTVIPAKAGIQRPLAANAYLPATGF